MRWKNRLVTSRPWAVAHDALHSFSVHEGMMMAGYLAYMALLAFFPFLIFLVALAGFLGDTALGMIFVRFLFERIPAEVSAILQPAVEEVLSRNRPGLLTFGIVISLWIVSSALAAVRTALDRAFHSRARYPLWRRGLEPFLATIIAAFAALIGVALVVFGPNVFRWLELILPIASNLGILLPLWQTVAPPALLFGAIVVLYWNLCSAKLSWPAVWPGALLTVTLWFFAAKGFSFYIAHFDRFPRTYGSLGGAALTLVFFYVLAAIFLLGAELNAALLRRRARD